MPPFAVWSSCYLSYFNSSHLTCLPSSLYVFMRGGGCQLVATSKLPLPLLSCIASNNSRRLNKTKRCASEYILWSNEASLRISVPSKQTFFCYESTHHVLESKLYMFSPFSNSVFSSFVFLWPNRLLLHYDVYYTVQQGRRRRRNLWRAVVKVDVYT